MRLFLLSGASRRDSRVALWFADDSPMRRVAAFWFDRIRACGEDVEELLHDGCPTACVKGAAFAYVGAFASHTSIGFFHGAALDDPAGLLQGGGKFMRHVKLRWGETIDEAAVEALIASAYEDISMRLQDAG